MSVEIHPTAQVAASAEISEGTSVGPYSIIGPNVKLEKNVRIHSHVVIEGDTFVGAGTEIFPFAAIGLNPQDLKFEGEESRLEIGTNCRIREHVTMNPGTKGGGLLTSIGNDCLIMVGAHIAHDCRIGNDVILVNNSALGGHCVVGDFAIIGGLSGIHQFVRIGEHAFVGGSSFIENDVIPFGSALGNRAYLGGLNLVGLRRRKFDRESIHTLRTAYRMIFSNEGTLSERIEDAATLFKGEPLVEKIVEFVRSGNDRSLCTPRSSRETT